MAKEPIGKDEIEFEMWNEDLQKAIVVRRRGRLFHVGGVDLALFPISVLADSIGRDVKTIRRWEREKVFPQPMWRVPDKRCKRWYSGNQVRFMLKQHNSLSKGDWGFSHSPHFPLKEFLASVRAGFYKCDTAAVQGAST